jgi:hypothetical protein
VVSPRLRQNSKHNKFVDIGIETAGSDAALPVEDVRIVCAALERVIETFLSTQCGAAILDWSG